MLSYINRRIFWDFARDLGILEEDDKTVFIYILFYTNLLIKCVALFYKIYSLKHNSQECFSQK